MVELRENSAGGTRDNLADDSPERAAPIVVWKCRFVTEPTDAVRQLSVELWAEKTVGIGYCGVKPIATSPN